QVVDAHAQRTVAQAQDLARGAVGVDDTQVGIEPEQPRLERVDDAPVVVGCHADLPACCEPARTLARNPASRKRQGQAASRQGRWSRRFNAPAAHSRASGNGPWPESTLMWPASP